MVSHEIDSLNLVASVILTFFYFYLNAGKLNRGISVVDTVQILKGEVLTEEEYNKASILGWCIELVSRMRRKKSINNLLFVNYS